jgi:hypothetical protein
MARRQVDNPGWGGYSVGMSKYACAVAGLLALSCGALAQTIEPAPRDGLRRFDYPAEHFSITAPATWMELDSALMALVPGLARQVAPNAFGIKISHLLKKSDMRVVYPYVAISMTAERPPEAALASWIRNKPDEFAQKWRELVSGGLIQTLDVKNVRYDRSRHVLWVVSETSFKVIGDIRVVSALYLIKAGAVQANCYSPASDYEKDESLCRQILDSVTFDRTADIGQVLPWSALIAMSQQDADKTYSDFVSRVQNGDFSIDFRLFRAACIRSSHCDPAGSLENRSEMSRRGLDPKSVARIAERLIEKGYVNAEAHATCSGAYSAINESAKAKFHFKVAEALVRSILETGDGNTRETAFEVISNREEIVMLVTKGLPYAGPDVSAVTTLTEGGHKYDRWELNRAGTQEPVTVFFNLDAIPGTVVRVKIR